MTDLKRAMGSHQSARSGSGVWLTPLYIPQALGKFDLDPCAHEGWPTAEALIYPPRDGLNEHWTGRVWLNPPYSRVWDWVSRLADYGDGIALVFARTETRGFVDHVWKRADAVKFVHGRLHFHYPDGRRAEANAGAPSVLAAYGSECARILRDDTAIPGTYLQLGDTDA